MPKKTRISRRLSSMHNKQQITIYERERDLPHARKAGISNKKKLG